MHVVLSLVVVAAVVAVVVRLCLRVGDSYAGRGPDGGGADRPERRPRGQRLRPLLPEGHRPPPGLGPLSPSERFLTAETTRGLRELQMFLVDQRAA